MNMKKLFLLNLPYLLFVYPFDKLAQAFRLAPSTDLSGKLLSIGDGFTAAFSSPCLSFHPTDLLIGITGAVVLRMAVYLKGKNAKKYRHGIEYGSARWGTAAARRGSSVSRRCCKLIRPMSALIRKEPYCRRSALSWNGRNTVSSAST